MTYCVKVWSDYTIKKEKLWLNNKKKLVPFFRKSLNYKNLKKIFSNT